MTGGPLGEFLSIAFDMLLFFILIMLASPFYLPIIVVSVILNFYLYKLNQPKIRAARREASRLRGPSTAHFAETVQGANVIKTYGKESVFYESFGKKIDDTLHAQYKADTSNNFFALQMSFLNIILLLFTASLGLWLIQKGFVSVGSLGVAFIFIAMISTTIQIFFEWIASVEDALSATERMSEYLFSELEPGAQLPLSSTFETSQPREKKIDPPRIKNNDTFNTPSSYALEVKNLSLNYQTDGPLILNNINFYVRPGEKIGIIGKTGSGKSSLIQALFHLYPFVCGEILVNGTQAALDLSDLNKKQNYVSLEDFRSSIFLLTQEPALYTGTLRENLTSHPQISDDELMHTARLIGFEKMILSHPDKLDMSIHEKGANISSGEKQLICMARCLLQNAPLILMDEATSAIDPQSEDNITRVIKNHLKNKTLISVAHRLSSIQECDRILWLDEGKIVMDDSPQRVLPLFKKHKNTHI